MPHAAAVAVAVGLWRHSSMTEMYLPSLTPGIGEIISTLFGCCDFGLDLHIQTCILYIPKMKGFRKLSYYKHTDRQTELCVSYRATPSWEKDIGQVSWLVVVWRSG